MPHKLALNYRSHVAQHRQRLWTHERRAPQLDQLAARSALKRELPRSDFNERVVGLYHGRFYPSPLLRTSDLPAKIFRVSSIGSSTFMADFNHPLARLLPDVECDLSPSVQGGVADSARIIDWAGIEAPSFDGWAEFSDVDSFEREDPTPDARFYKTPRRVLHIDSVCASRITALYNRLIPEHATVLDLMAGWRSHLPDHLSSAGGLGLNEAEMRDNPQLTEFTVCDLNCTAELPFPDETFDAILNCVSIEYLLQPSAVLRSAFDKLRFGGVLIVTFSNRFFPLKVIRLWTRLHPVERIGWVLRLMHESGYRKLHTLIERGLPRSQNDPYANQLKEMDPLMAVWGYKPQPAAGRESFLDCEVAPCDMQS